ncbi:MAG TPA: rhomboid family intramembrane serine protease [Candidatus Polarisedimenticolaceae bacterium]|nr:rhomboid family intramembrane serine protease [Candidatus Polarisedimenticolaceae bacterium]
MLLIPAGQEPASAKRIPWVTLALVLVCAAVFPLTGFGTWNTPFKAAQRNEEALRYFMDHPYLTLRPQVETSLFGADEATSRTVIEGLKASHPAPGADVAAREQVRLDHLVAGAFNDAAVDPFQRFGLVPADPGALAWITHLFLHPGWLAFLGNLLLLYLAGPFVEDALGAALFALLYLVCGIGAAAAMVLPHGDATTPVVGAGGAVAGCVGALLARHRLGKVPFFYWAIVRSGTFEVPAWTVALVWVGVQAALVHFGAAATGAMAGHAAGLALGALATVALRETDAAPRLSTAPATRPVANTRAVLAEARRARESGDLEIAISILRQHLAENPGDRDTVLALWDVSVERGNAADVAPAMKGIVRAELQSNQLDLAAAHWVDLIRVSPTMTLDTASLLKMVAPLVAARRKDDALAVLRRAMLTAGTNVPTASALRIAILAADLDPRLARSLLQLVLGRPGLDPTERMQAEKILAAVEPVPVESPAS